MPAVPLSRCPDVLYAPSLLIIECGAVAEDFLLDSLDGIGFSAKCSQAKPISYTHTHRTSPCECVCESLFMGVRLSGLPVAGDRGRTKDAGVCA